MNLSTDMVTLEYLGSSIAHNLGTKHEAKIQLKITDYLIVFNIMNGQTFYILYW